MPHDSLPTEDLDHALARIAAATASLADAEHDAAARERERAIIADLALTASRLRQTVKGAGGESTGLPDAVEPDIDPLTRFAIRRGTDKWGPHFYTPIYHDLFRHWRSLPIRLLEIGIGGHGSPVVGGASLLMWADYFPQARIVGIDISEKRLPPHPRITILRGSQNDASFLTTVAANHGPFDIVIDDGSHRPSDAAASFNALFPTLAQTGIYVIEDAQTAFWPAAGGSVEDGAETMALVHSALRALHHAEIHLVQPEWAAPVIAQQIRSIRAYHNLLVFEKGDNGEPSTGMYDAANAHVIRAMATMERELAHEPTPDGLANLARTYHMARRSGEALATVQRGLERWPDHVRLLMIGMKAAHRLRDDEMERHFKECLTRATGTEPEAG